MGWFIRVWQSLNQSSIALALGNTRLNIAPGKPQYQKKNTQTPKQNDFFFKKDWIGKKVISFLSIYIIDDVFVVCVCVRVPRKLFWLHVNGMWFGWVWWQYGTVVIILQNKRNNTKEEKDRLIIIYNYVLNFQIWLNLMV